MKTLVIDSHKGTDDTEQANLHWKNAKIISDFLGAKFIWSYPSVNAKIEENFDIIILVHASHYCYVDYAWIEKSPNAKLFYITNEYNLGEARILWTAAKAGRKYEVIANHPPEPSKIVQKYVDKWHIINLNALIYKPYTTKKNWLFDERRGIVYYGNFRKDRAVSYRKYLKGNIVISTHIENQKEYLDCGCTGKFIPRILWPEKGDGLDSFLGSLYLEDETTRIHYNFLANRFYEALNHNCVPLFDAFCSNTFQNCLYNIPKELKVFDPKEYIEIEKALSAGTIVMPKEWNEIARQEKETTLHKIKELCN